MLKKISAIAIKSFALLLVLGTAYQAVAQAATTPSTTTPYAKMAPIDQGLHGISNRNNGRTRVRHSDATVVRRNGGR